LSYDATELAVFIILVGAVMVSGFIASRWRRGDLSLLEEWGLAGRRFGTLITWFLLGGDLYTAYTFIAVPALVFGSGAIGFFAVPYTLLVYPIVYVTMPRLWNVARRRNHITAADYVKDRFSSPLLALLIAITGFLATMPYIALQIVGMGYVLDVMGLPAEYSLIITFLILAAYTYVSGLRAPALTAVIKDIMVLLAVFVGIVYIPLRLGGFAHVFQSVPATKLTLPPKLYLDYATLALGSALALFLYPHAVTGTLSSSSSNVVRRNAAMLPVYSIMLAFIAIFGWVGLAAGLKLKSPNLVVPVLFNNYFPDWFTGFAFAAISVGSLVPASVMSIAAANLFSRNIYKEYLDKRADLKRESNVSKVVSFLVKVGALVFAIYAPTYAIQLQLAGGAWIIQTLPAVMLSLYTDKLNKYSIIAGWVVGMSTASYMLAVNKFAASAYVPRFFGLSVPMYIAVISLILNLVVVLVGTLIAHAMGQRAKSPILEEEFQDQAPSAQTQAAGGKQ
jgi:SSS family solute:Na+ symporter